MTFEVGRRGKAGRLRKLRTPASGRLVGFENHSGPVLHKNSWLTDHLICRALLHRYGDTGTLDSLMPLEDQTADEAHAAALRLASRSRPAGRWQAVREMAWSSH